MIVIKRFILIFVSVWCVLPFSFVSKGNDISAACAIAVETSEFDIYFDEAADDRHEIASLTKIMTVVIALENGGDLSRVVTVADEAIGTEGTSIYLKSGEQMTVSDLIWAVLLNSANDASVALAVAVGGSVEEFVAMMNAKAYALCMNATHYVNPNGLPAEDHYSSAKDLAILACYALSVEGFKEISSSYTHSIPYDGVANGRQLVNHNKLVKQYDGCIGMKTGFTKSAGRCLVTAAQRDGVTLVCVTLDDGNDWNDHKTLLNIGFDTYERVVLSAQSEQGFGIPVAGEERLVLCANEADVSAVLKKDRSEVIKSLNVPDFVYGPINLHDKIGTVTYKYNGKVIGEDSIVVIETDP
ncbi:MAG: D-alanyl-D-alanine carboxypeptidase [Clostridiales bacterium]|nr:D-alanyl-D-alanine carboxypeptidase [Clostridiales bacterium]